MTRLLVLALVLLASPAIADTRAGGGYADVAVTVRASAGKVTIGWIDESRGLVFTATGTPIYYTQMTFTANGVTFVQSGFDIWGTGSFNGGSPQIWLGHFAFNDNGPIGDEIGAGFRLTPGGTRFYSTKGALEFGQVTITP